MGSGALRFRLSTHNDMKQILVTLLLLGALLAVTEGKRRGGKPKKARSGRGGERSWHIAGEEGETSCGNSTEIFTTETPSSLCTEAGSNFCICATRGASLEIALKLRKMPSLKLNYSSSAFSR